MRSYFRISFLAFFKAKTTHKIPRKEGKKIFFFKVQKSKNGRYGRIERPPTIWTSEGKKEKEIDSSRDVQLAYLLHDLPEKKINGILNS